MGSCVRMLFPRVREVWSIFLSPKQKVADINKKDIHSAASMCIYIEMNNIQQKSTFSKLRERLRLEISEIYFHFDASMCIYLNRNFRLNR